MEKKRVANQDSPIERTEMEEFLDDIRWIRTKWKNSKLVEVRKMCTMFSVGIQAIRLNRILDLSALLFKFGKDLANEGSYQESD